MSDLREIMTDAITRAQVVEHDGYFDIYPDFGSLKIEPDLVKTVCKRLAEIGDYNCDKIALIESMAITVGTALALDRKLPYTVIRKRRYNLPGEVSVREQTGYDRADFYINGVEKGDKIIVFDDTINTGETIAAVVKTIRHIGADVADILTIMDKGTHRRAMGKELGIPIKTIVAVRITADSVNVEFPEE